MVDVQYRSFEPDLEVRAKGDGRTIVGIAVPYDTRQYITRDLVEQFAYGAFDEQLGPVLDGGVLRRANTIPFTRDHLGQGGTLIGRATLLRNDAAGLYGEWRVSKTPAGDETLELVRDGALRELSIGFREGANRRMPDGTVERVTAELHEVAIVVRGAYGENALVSALRAAGITAGPQGTPDRYRLAQLLQNLPERGRR